MELSDTASAPLTPYLPRRLVRTLAARGGPATRPEVDEFEGAVVFADLAGFTPLAERLAQQGARGIEELNGILTGLFGTIVDHVHASGGDVVTFAGDAVLAIWPESGAGLRDAVLRASRCAAGCQRRLAHGPLGAELNIGVSVGRCVLHEVGGSAGRWTIAAGGPAVIEVGRAERRATGGGILLTAAAAAAVGDALPLTEDGEHWRLGDVEDANGASAMPDVAGPPVVAPAAALRPYLSTAVLSRIDAGQARWLAELRPVSVVFVRLNGFAPGPGPGGDALQRAVVHAESVLGIHGGVINKLLCDDWGTTLLMGFGLPPGAQEDDAVRAVRAAQAMAERCHDEGWSFGIGVTTGRAYCGTYGAAARRDYTMLGDTVNLAARLMETAKNEVLCDGRTVRETVERLVFEELEPVSVRGKDEVVVVARPVGERGLPERHEVLLLGRHEALRTGRVDATTTGDLTHGIGFGGASSARVDIVGRVQERDLIALRLQELDGIGRKGVIAVEAEAGLGKSLLGAWLHAEALGLQLLPFLGACEPSAATSAWHPWREVFAPLLLPEGGDEPAGVIERVQRLVAGQPRLMAWAPLVEALLPFRLPATETTARMTGPTRAAALSELLLALLRGEAARRPLVVLIEDVHWMDPTSWAFAGAVASGLDDALLVLLGRPCEGPARASLELIEGRQDCDSLILGPLSQEEIIELARRRLAVRALPTVVGEAIAQRAQGNPFFAQELTLALQESGRVVVSDDELVVVDSDLAIDLPDTVQGVVTSRLDRVPPAAAVTARVAAVIGRSFEEALLVEVHPERDTVESRLDLSVLATARLVEREGIASQDHWGFRHALIQETAYAQLPFARRRVLHAAVADALEARREDALDPVIAWHWRLAEESARALDAYERAATGAVRRGAHAEALSMVDHAFSLALDGPGAAVSPLARQALWHELRADALLMAGEIVACKASYERALAGLGAPLPQSKAGWAAFLMREVLTQVRARVFGPRRLPAAAIEDHSARIGALYSRFSAAAYFTIEPLHWFLGGLAAVNVADRTGDDQPVGQALGSFGNVVGALKLQRAARYYFARVRPVQDARDRTVAAWAESVFELTYCRWGEAGAVLGEAIPLAERTADRYSLGLGYTIAAVRSFLCGAPAQAVAEHGQVLGIARGTGNTEHLSWGLTFSVPALLAVGDRASLDRNLAEASALIDRLDPFTHVGFHGARAQVRARDGDHDGALADVAAMLAIFDRHPLPLFNHLPGFGGAVEAALVALEHERRGGALRVPAGWTLPRLVRRARSLLRMGALSYHYFRPRHHLYAGTQAWLRGGFRGARRAWARAQASAERLGLPYEAALVDLERARLLPRDDVQRHAALARAHDAFTAMGATGDLARLDRLRA